MELQVARRIIDTLAQGIHPVAGELLPEDSPSNAPPVIRALPAVSRALEATPPRRAAAPKVKRGKVGAPAGGGRYGS